MNKASTRTDVVAIATKQTIHDRIAAHNGAILCSNKGCRETATITMFFVSGRVSKYCKYHTEKSGFFPVYAIAEHDTIYGDKSKSERR